MTKLSKALESDTAYLEKKAGQANMPVVQYKAIEQLRHENALMKAAQKEAQTGQAVGGQLQKWMTEGERIKADYKDFDLAGESKNPRFLALLRSGVPMVHAYEVLHLGDIKQGVATQTARQTEKRVVDGIRAKGTRPLENGMSSGSGIVVKSDVSRLTKKDRQEIAKRALQGEKISF